MVHDRPRVGYCQKHASARFRPLVPVDRHRNQRFRTSRPVDYDLSVTLASDGSINRYYDPSNAQFLSVDPLVGTTRQPYGFAAEDPFLYADPIGLCVAADSSPQGHYNCRGRWIPSTPSVPASPNGPLIPAAPIEPISGGSAWGGRACVIAMGVSACTALMNPGHALNPDNQVYDPTGGIPEIIKVAPPQPNQGSWKFYDPRMSTPPASITFFAQNQAANEQSRTAPTLSVPSFAYSPPAWIQYFGQGGPGVGAATVGAGATITVLGTLLLLAYLAGEAG